MAEETCIRMSDVTAHHYLIAADSVLSRPQMKITRPDPAYEAK